MPVTAENRSITSKLQVCLAAVRGWLSYNFLLLNAAKTEMMVVGPLDDCVIHCRDTVKNLDILFDKTFF